jgi:hypothetical protein
MIRHFDWLLLYVVTDLKTRKIAHIIPAKETCYYFEVPSSVVEAQKEERFQTKFGIDLCLVRVLK